MPASANPSASPGPKIAILLCTYNGEKYLAEQLDSFARQSHANWVTWASDDNSQDGTLAILHDYQRQWGAEKLAIIQGPAKGCTLNFLSLTVNKEVQADYYAFSDQDDIWEADKLKHALAWLETVPASQAALYCSRTLFVDADNREIAVSQLYTRPPGFANALMQNIASGNTMVFNDAARRLICEAGKDVNVMIHDWWAYLLISGCGGRVFYDSYPSLRYRQHEDNLIGMNTSWPARLLRIRKLFQGHLKGWTDQNIWALQSQKSKLTSENRQLLDQFSEARQRWLLPRLIGLKRSGIYRQTMLGNMGLVAAALFKKL